MPIFELIYNNLLCYRIWITYFPFLEAVNIISCSLPLLVHIRQMECFERIKTGLTMRGHCSSVFDLSPIMIKKCLIKKKLPNYVEKYLLAFFYDNIRKMFSFDYRLLSYSWCIVRHFKIARCVISIITWTWVFMRTL